MTFESDSGHSRKDDRAHTRRRDAYVINRIDKLTKNGRKIELSWNSKGQPIGEYASLFQHYISYHTRARVSVGIPKWKAVPREVKDLICQAVMEKFVIDQSNMKLITLSVAKKRGDFKHNLTKEYLYMKEDKGQIRTQPPEEFPFIDKDTWVEFIKQRCTSEFQEISERNSELAKQNKYPFRSSRKSYARIEEELLREQGLDPTNSSLPRCELWMAGRQTYNGNIDGEVVNVVRNIGSLKEQVSLGQISPEGREDILDLALGKEEHAGRIRGVGAGVGVKKYFPENRHRNSSAASENQNSESKTPSVERTQPLDKRKWMKIYTDTNNTYATTLEKYRITYPSLPSYFLITIDIAKDILNYTQQLHVGKEQIRVCLQKDAMDNVHLALYMKYLYESCPSNIYAFFCPTYIADGYKDSKEKKERYMVDSMSELEMTNRIWFAAYNQGFHWMLAVINPWDNIVYWLDPLRKGVPDKFRAMVDTVQNKSQTL